MTLVAFQNILQNKSKMEFKYIVHQAPKQHYNNLETPKSLSNLKQQENC